MPTSGRGDYPLRSRWINPTNLRKLFFYADADQSTKTFMENWFFEAAPAVTETITAQNFPMGYLEETVKAEELISKVEGATITTISKDFPQILLKSGKAKELKSKWA